MLNFVQIFDSSHLPACLVEPYKPNALVYVNSAYCELTGYSKEELLGKSPGSLLQGSNHTGEYTKIKETIRYHIDRFEPVDVLVKNFKKNGSAYWVELHIHPVWDKDTGQYKYWVGVATDVTLYVLAATQRLESIVETIKNDFGALKEELRLL